MEAAAKTYSSTGLAVVSVVSSVVVLSVSALPPQAVRASAMDRARTREKSFFMAKSSFLDDNMLNPALQVRCQTDVIFK